MSNIGFSELLFILILAFIILGPEQLPKAMYNLGLIFKKIKQQYQDFHNEINNTINKPPASTKNTKNNNFE